MRIEEVTKVCVVGGGTMGMVIALRCAGKGGYDVTIHDISDEVLQGTRTRLREVAPLIVGMGLLSQDDFEDALGRIGYSSDPASAAAGADVLSESVPEILDIKRQTHALFDGLLPPHAVQTTNTSHLLVSDMEDVVGRGDRFAALHFHGAGGSVVDIMRGPRTSDETVGFLVDFANSIGEIPNVMRKEKAGYLYNNLLGAMLRTALTLAIEGCAEPHEIDRIFMRLSGLPHGPFGIMDAVGLNVILDAQSNLAERDQPATREQIAGYLRPFIERGELGLKTGKGFYDYPEPAYQKPDFLSAHPSD